MVQGALGQDSLVGRILGHYRIIERIGAGGMGVVYRAWDEHLDNREVAIKILPQGSLADDQSRQRFRKEAHALSRLNHPNIASVIDFDYCEGMDYLVEEFVAGISLDEMLKTGPLPEEEIISFGLQLCKGLAAAHAHGVIHRDIKPGNIRVTPQANLKIIDFGLAKTLCPPQPRAGNETITLSEPQIVAGTLPYISPEQLRNDELDGRTDIWAAGCVLYEMATGRRPFLGSGPALIDAILHEPPADIGKLNPKTSEALKPVIGKCLEKDREKRYGSAEMVAVEIRHAAASMAAGAQVRWRHWLITPLAVVVVAAVVVVGLSTKTGLQHRSLEKSTATLTAPGIPIAHESYLAGRKQLERWDKAGNIDRAIVDFQQAIKADPRFALGYSGLAESYWAKYRLDRNPQWIDEAEANCRRAAELNSQLPAVYVTLARLHNGKGEYNLALQEIGQALKLEPNDPDALLGEALVYASMGRAQEAESAFKKAAALRPQYWGGHYELGGFYYRQKRYADAAAEFQSAIELTPDNALAHATLGAVMQLLQENQKAEEQLKHSLDLQPSYAAYTNLGALYYRERRWQESAIMTQNALAINSKDYAAWVNLGMTYEWLDQPDKADEAYRQALVRLEVLAKVRADDADVQAELGVLYARKQQRKKAIPQIEAALARSPNDPVILSNAAEIYECLGERGRALEFIKKALASGLTLAQLQRDPILRDLLLDSKFPAILTNSKPSSSAKSK
jgi:serine/threonine-protein kinase